MSALSKMTLDNDTRGWIMACVSGIACVLGSSIICIDFLVRLFPGKRHFKVQDSNTFLSASLSLSFGVMLFSALYSMLPSANRYLKNSGLSPKPAAWVLIGGFVGGVIGIRIVSHLLHSYIPTEIVDCDHSHEHEGEGNDDRKKVGHDHHQDENGHAKHHEEVPNGVRNGQGKAQDLERTPLLSREDHLHRHGPGDGRKQSVQQHPPHGNTTTHTRGAETGSRKPNQLTRRPSLQARLRSQMSSIVYGDSNACDETGSCYGYSNPCGRECLKFLPMKSSDHERAIPSRYTRKPTFPRSVTAPFTQNDTNRIYDEEIATISDERQIDGGVIITEADQESEIDGDGFIPSGDEFQDEQQPRPDDGNAMESNTDSKENNDSSQSQSQHHHHVPTNAFMSIGLQTSIAIALHKLPEGFITYATNHANSRLGFAVFMALFIHNITEGFAMALPLYLAIGSRWKAMFWSSLLGGFSQPLGAGVAALWFKLAGKGNMAPGEGVYGAMFAITGEFLIQIHTPY
ncbi:MAG: protein translocase subunit [Watsoniomyces obsoletus]|nr:MAG: protein translocase subunit [Watsoniomyces obsoletus]